MRLNLREIIEVPGAWVPFSCELETEGLDFPQIRAYKAKPHAEGRVYNEAGILTLEGTLTAELICICDRCGSELIIRKDDEPETVLKRLTVYHDQTQPLIDHYGKQDKLVAVDGTLSVEEVTNAIIAKLEA